MKRYTGLSELSTKVLFWQASAVQELPHSLWIESYEVLWSYEGALHTKFWYIQTDIEDVIQDVAICIPKIAQSYTAENNADFSTTLFSALKNTAISYFRARKMRDAHRPNLEDYIIRLARQRIPDAFEQACYNELVDKMNATMATFSENERSMLALAMDELPYADIALAFGKTIDGIKGKVYRARIKLKRAMKAYNPARQLGNGSKQLSAKAVRKIKSLPVAKRETADR